MRRVPPVIASGTVILTLITCFIIAKINKIYIGGLTWPYFSDLGRDSPGYYVFCVGLTIVAIALCATWYFNYKFQRSALRVLALLGYVSPFVGWATKTVAFVGILSTLGLPTLAFFSTTSYPSLHNNAAYWFFLLETVAIFFNTFISYRLVKSAKALEVPAEEVPVICDFDGRNVETKHLAMHRTLRLQMICSILFLIAFLLYLPIGLTIVKPFKRLEIAQCLERNLGHKYCTVTMRLDKTQTKLWDYEDDYTATQMRAAAQLCCIITLVGYSISFLTHDVPQQVPSSRLKSNQFHAIPILLSPADYLSDVASETRSGHGNQ